MARWRCSSCEKSFPVCDSFAVTHRVDDAEVTAIVCPTCADGFAAT